VPGTLLSSEETAVLHIQLYRARKRYRDMVSAIADEAARRLPNAERLAELRARRDEARQRAERIELEMTMGEAVPA
jgi:hypothetical protein